MVGSGVDGIGWVELELVEIGSREKRWIGKEICLRAEGENGVGRGFCWSDFKMCS